MYKLLSPEAVAALKKYNTDAINKFAKKREIHVTDIADHESPPSEDTIHEEQPDPQQVCCDNVVCNVNTLTNKDET